MSEAGEKLTQVRCQVMVKDPWYGHIAMNMRWVENSMEFMPPEQRTMGVRIVDGGIVECVYSPEFVEKHDHAQLYATVQHEIEHIVRLHPVRLTNDQDPIIRNIAADMTVNGRENAIRIGYDDPKTKRRRLPCDDEQGKHHIVFIPNDWPDDETYEYYYERLIEEQKKNEQGGGGNNEDDDDNNEQNDKDSDGSGGKNSSDKSKSKGKNRCKSGAGDKDDKKNKGGKKPKQFDNHDVWKDSTVSADEARQIVKSICDSATSQAPGNVPGHLQASLESLKKPLVSWREILRQYIGRHVGNRRMTWSRRSRRTDSFGVKGVSHRSAAKVTIIVDVSGSTEHLLKNFFAEIENICFRARVSVVQWDFDFQDFWPVYRRSDWKKIKIKGLGGTRMAAAVDWVEEKGIVGDCVIMLTDGETDWPEPKQFPMVFMIANRSEVSGPTWGNIVRVTNADE